jgi:hypothetical protein
MAYEVVYDVAADGYLPAHVRGQIYPVILLPLAVVVVFLLSAWKEARENLERKPGAKTVTYGKVRLLFSGLILLLWAFFAVEVWSGYQEQVRCRTWLAQGQGEVVEGPIRNLRHERAGNPKFSHTCFEVGPTTLRFGWSFSDHGGFKGSFTTASPGWHLADGERVRITHRAGRILRIERMRFPGGHGA